ncbi:MAG: hypothetical protein GWP15_03490 [Nitrospirae bacterium]|nr:hypothetical protein [Nitrospirota bacterium]
MKFRDRIFSSFLDDGEKILYVAHRHIVIFKIDAAKPMFFGLAIPAILYLFFPQAWPIFVIWGLVGLLVIFYYFIDWYYDAWLLTNIGVVDVERNGLFDITATRVEYHMMEGMSYTIKGLLQTFLNYGDITVDKLGAQTFVVLKDASKPKKLERLVMKYQEQFVNERSVRDHHALKGMLSDMIAYHIQNKKIDSSKKDK